MASFGHCRVCVYDMGMAISCMITCRFFAAALAVFLLAGCKPGPRDAEAAPANPTTRPAAPWKNLSVDEAENVAKDAQMIILDVRTPGEYKAGRLHRAININVNAADFAQQVDKLDKSKPLFFYCATGNRSVRAAEKLVEKGFTNLYHMEKGFKAWERAGKPVEQ